MIANTSSGIEPQFSLVYVKTVMDGEKLLYVNPVFEERMKDMGLYSKELMLKISEAGSLNGIDEIPKEIKKVFVTSHDIVPEWHLKMQGAFQKFTDNAVSKTINFSRSATKDDIRNSFLLAYDLGCKGVTVYRDGSRENQVLSVGSSEPKYNQEVERVTETGCGHLYVTVNSDEKGAFELFTQMGKVGGCASAQLEAIARLASLCLRTNVKVESLIHHLRGIRCPSPMWHKGRIITSCADAIATSLESFLQLYQDGRLNGLSTLKTNDDDINDVNGNPAKGTTHVIGGACPDCGGTIEFSEGCKKCNLCGWSKC